MSEFRFVDLFAGIGGARAAYEREGGDCVFSCEINEDARDVYESNWDDPVSEHDIQNFEPDVVPSHDVLLACWPCPSFSQMGDLDGLEDDRGMLFFEIVDILKAKQPKAFMLENVKNLQFVKDGEAYETVINALRTAGYTVFSQVMNALDFGVPQHRERLIIVGFRDDVAPSELDFTLPEKSPAALESEDDQRNALREILEENPKDKYEASSKIKSDRRESVENPDDIPTPSVWHENRGGRVVPRPYAGALRASASWNYLLVNGERHLTVRELLRLQGFPEWFEISDSNQSRARRLTGNTVPVPMVQSVATAVIDELLDRTENPTPKNAKEPSQGD